MNPSHDAPGRLPALQPIAIVDIGSNSVRLVVFEGHGRNPLTIFNEKAVLRLGKGLQGTGRLNEEAVAAAVPVMQRYHAELARGRDAAEALCLVGEQVDRPSPFVCFGAAWRA